MESQEKKTILIFDQSNQLADAILKKLPESFFSVFLTSKTIRHAKNMYHVQLTKKIPILPNCVYSVMLLVYSRDPQFSHLLPFFIQKAEADNAKIMIIISHKHANKKTIEHLTSLSPSINVIILGDLFGEMSRWESDVSMLLEESKSGRVTLPENGLLHVFPIEDEAAISYLVQIISGEKRIHHRVIRLMPSHPVTMLTLARYLHKKEPLLELKLLPGNAAHNKTDEYMQNPSFDAAYTFQEKLPEVSIIPGYTYNPKSTQVIERRKKASPYTKVALIIVIFGLVFGFGLPVTSSVIGGEYLKRAYLQIKEGNLKKARLSATSAKQFFQYAQKTQGSIALLQFVGLRKGAAEIEEGISTGTEIADIFLSGIEGLTYLEKVFIQQSEDPARDFSLGTRYVQSSLAQLAALRVENKIPQQYREKIDSLQKVYTVFAGTIDVLPVVLGMEGTRTYLMLFQNNMELRPGGGFIGSYGLLELEKGKISNFTIQDIYDADGQLKKHIEPPFQLQRYMDAENWFMRDSNFDVDFPKSAASVANFYKLETGEKVDGVIAVDTDFIKNILQEIGPLAIPEYNETVSADNFFLLTQKYVQDDFFPGSTQKKDFLRAVYTSLSLLLTDSEKSNYMQVVNAIAKSVSQKHIVFAFPDEGLQKVFTLNGFSSTLADNRDTNDSQMNDFLGINEANIGANKVNYYIDRAITHSVVLDNSGMAKETVMVQYHNNSKEGDAFGGEYKNYLRVILPGGAELKSIDFDGASQEIEPAITDATLFPSSIPLNHLEVEATEQEGKKVYGFFVSIPMSSKKTIKVQYVVPITVGTGQASGIYSLSLFKQPGTQADPYAFSLIVPTDYQIISKDKKVKVSGKTMTYLTDLSEDREIEATIVKK